jgi:hypothetical protein
MGGQATVAEVQAEDFSAQLQSRIRGFTAFYEQHAYLAYNVALRIACEPEAATRAVHRAFLAQLDDRPGGLLPAAVAAALHEAPSRPEPDGAGDAQAAALLAAAAALSPPERAALAMSDLAHAGPDGIGEALGLDGEQAAKLLHRGREAFSARLGLPRTQADEAAGQWMWAAPPDTIWEELYPKFHQAVERQLRRGVGEQTLILAASSVTAPAGGRPRRRSRRRLRWSRRPRWGIVIPLVAILVGGSAGAAITLTSGGAGGHSENGPSYPGAAVAPQSADSSAAVTGSDAKPVAKPHKPLTPAQLDKLRLRELRMLSKYTKRQADKRLSVDQRSAAARQIDELRREAQRRLRAQSKRDQAARDRLARERAKSKAPPPPAPTAPTKTAPAPKRSAPKQESTGPSGAPKNQDEADKTCLMDQDSGQYICPQ